jgi:hypothetical protein
VLSEIVAHGKQILGDRGHWSDLKNNPDAQDIIALNLTRAVQVCVDIAARWLSAQGKSGSPRVIVKSGV